MDTNVLTSKKYITNIMNRLEDVSVILLDFPILSEIYIDIGMKTTSYSQKNVLMMSLISFNLLVPKPLCVYCLNHL